MILNLVVVMLPDPFRGMGERRNSAETQQLDNAPRSGPDEWGTTTCSDSAGNLPFRVTSRIETGTAPPRWWDGETSVRGC